MVPDGAPSVAVEIADPVLHERELVDEERERPGGEGRVGVRIGLEVGIGVARSTVGARIFIGRGVGDAVLVAACRGSDDERARPYCALRSEKQYPPSSVSSG
jgi:hypothetical protein